MSDWRGLHSLHSNWRFGQPTQRWITGYEPPRRWNVPAIIAGAIVVMLIVAGICRVWP